MDPSLTWSVWSGDRWTDEGGATLGPQMLVAWKLPDGWTALPDRTAAVFCFGAGHDQLTDDPRLPRDLPVMRLIDPGQTQQICDYVLAAVFERLLGPIGLSAGKGGGRHWPEAMIPRMARRDLRVTVLGLGATGSVVAGQVAALGFSVRGWSRRMRVVPGCEVLAGETTLFDAAADADVLVNLLPGADELGGVLSAPIFGRLANGSHLVHLGRGLHLVEADLRSALDAGRPAFAWLDVFAREPLPPEHWFWRDPRIHVTPHTAGLPTAEDAARSIVAAAHALRDGTPLPGRIR
ncbi:NAD(P)-dependent oxidoreductase [Faunimonas pinastri]|uniref:NAD(P)-dependent oxidoreductase n=1 Tax=Faunimonas pinastri TaxID=1855383 RepID=UPI0015A57D2D|nr:NAD(P)-dependent oxidoreductase [Faunimonas pinastri]